MKWFVKLSLVLLCLDLALGIEQILLDQKLEAEANDIFQHVRCVVCNGQAIADSNAEISRTMRKIIRDKLAKGYSRKQIEEFLVERYGPEVLIGLPHDSTRYVLWLVPIIVIVCGSVFYYTDKNRTKLPT